MVSKVYRANYRDPKIGDSRIARLRLLRETLIDHRLGTGLYTLQSVWRNQFLARYLGGQSSE